MELRNEERIKRTGHPGRPKMMTPPAATIVCHGCGRELPAEAFEMMKTGTRRHVCNDCKYQLYTLPAYMRRKLNGC